MQVCDLGRCSHATGYLVFRLYDDNLALYGKRYFYYVWELPVFALVGAVAGLLGALFISLNIWATALRARYVPPRKPRLRLVEVCLVQHVASSCPQADPSLC